MHRCHPPRLVLLAAALLGACNGSPAPGAAAEPRRPSCEWCGAAEAPAELSSEMVLAGPDEPGEPLVLDGTIYGPDGETPAEGVLLYAYHTDVGGRYTPGPSPAGNEVRHGKLRGWLRTGADGRYRIVTIRPGSYPGGEAPQHVHLTVQPPGGDETYIDDVVFSDDPLLTPAHRARLRGRGGSGVVTPRRGEDGVWRATRDIVLPSAGA